MQAARAPRSRVRSREAVDDTFNMISVDGDMSTNDCIYALAKPGTAEASPGLRAALHTVCRELALDMVKDGEGASKTLTVHVTGARIRRRRGRLRAQSSTRAWSRRRCTVKIRTGAASSRLREAWEAACDDDAWSITLGGSRWVDRCAQEVLTEAEAHSLLEHKSIKIGLDLGMGDAEATGYGCDLTLEYVRINAHYRT